MFGEILFYVGMLIVFVVAFFVTTWVLQSLADHEIFREQHIGGALVISLVTVGTGGYLRDLSLRPLFFFAVMVTVGWLAYRIRDRGREQYILWDGPDVKAHIGVVLAAFALTAGVGLVFAPFSVGLLVAALVVYGLTWCLMFPM